MTERPGRTTTKSSPHLARSSPRNKQQRKKRTRTTQKKKENRMFMVVEMEQNIRLHPRDLGPKLREKVAAQLIRDAEGKCSGKYGYVVAVTGLKSLGAGEILSGTTYVRFRLRYECLVCRPFRREVFEAVVTRVIANGFFAECGPLDIFVSSFCMPEGRYELQRGHDDGEFQFVDTEFGERIAPGTEVRVAVVGSRFDATHISCVGTIRGDYLGVVTSAKESH